MGIVSPSAPNCRQSASFALRRRPWRGWSYFHIMERICLQCMRCGLQMSHVAWSVCMCVGHTSELCKNGWTDRDAVGGGLTHIGPRNHALVGGQDRTNPFTTAYGWQRAMRPLAILLWTLVRLKMLKGKERNSIYIAPFILRSLKARRHMDHTVLPANYPVSAFPS